MTLSPFSEKQQCNCLHGTAVIDPVTDQCYCVDNLPQTGGVRPPLGGGVSEPVKPIIRSGPGGMWGYFPYSSTNIVDTSTKAKPKAASLVADDGTILGLKPVWLIAIVAGGLWLMSQSGGNTKTKGGAA